MNSATSTPLVDLQFDMYRICDGTMHKEIVSLPEDEFQPSLSYLRQLIETRFNIPIICQVKLSLLEVPLDCLPPHSDLFSRRICRKGERVVIKLEYFANSVRLKPIEMLLARFDDELKARNYRKLYVMIYSLNHEHINMHGWESNEAMATRIFIYSSGFLDQLYNCIQFLNEQLINSHNNFIEFINQEPENQSIPEKLRLLGTADSISTALTSVLGLVWNLGAKGTDRIRLYTRGFLELSQESMHLANYHLLRSSQREFVGIGREVFAKCLGVIQGYSELRAPAIKIGHDLKLMEILQNNILHSDRLSNEHMEDVLQILVLFSCSTQHEISKLFLQYNVYANMLQHFRSVIPNEDYYNKSYEIFYIACLFMLNCLRTPFVVQISHSFLIDLLKMFNTFFQNINLQHIINFEDRTKFLWGSLDPFLSYFFIPQDSLIGCLGRSASSQHDLYSQLTNSYYTLTLFCLDVLLSREPSRQQLIDENLITFLIIAHWNIPNAGIYDRLKKWYPEISYLSVPTLYDIAATKVASLGYREFVEVIHPSV